MKVMMLSVVLFSLSGVAHATSESDTTKIPCASVQHVVESMGAIVLKTENGQFDRFVRDGSFCSARQVTAQAFTTALDDRNCPAGLRCEDLVN